MDLRNLILFVVCISLQALALGQAPVSDSQRTNSASKTREYLSTTIINPDTREFKPGDSFLFSIKEDPTKGGGGIQTIKVNDAGDAIFPVSFSSKLYVKVNVKSMKLEDIRQKVKSLLDEDYYNDATVFVEFTQANRSRVEQDLQVQIYGEMQGVVYLRENEVKRVSDAILSLSRSPFADLRRVRLHRIDSDTGKEEIKTINVDKILREGDRSADEVLQDGDRIEVRPKTFNF
jgi:protein involved in polysaccharide export with SLBB domain